MIDNILDIDIDLGIEMKIVYDKTTAPEAEVQLIFNNAEDIASSSFLLPLIYGFCIIYNCEVQLLDMSTVQDGIPFILKIYRKDGKFMIDLDGVNKVEMDINSPNNIQQGCHLLWGTDDKRSFYFGEKSRGVATHYRMVVGDEDDDDYREVDVKGKLSKFAQM